MINVSLRSEIMKDYVPGSELAGDRDIAAAMQKDGTLLLFSIGVDEHVYMLTKAPGSSTGWERTDLSADLPAGVRTLHLCAAQAIDGSPILAIATASKSGAERTIYVATDFTPSPKPGRRWAPRGSCTGSEITAMTTGSTADGRPVVVVATVNAQRQLSTFFLHPDPSGKETVWKEVPLPLNGSGVVDMAIGHNAKLEAKIPGLEGLIYTLLRVDDVTTRLIVTSFPDFTIYNHVVPVTIRPAALAAIGLPSGDTQLFVGTDSLYGLSPEQQITQDATHVSEAATKIVSMGPDASARAMCAGRHPDGRLEIWWLNQNGILSFVEEKPAGGWGQPIGLQKQVGEMTAWRNPVSSDIDLFTVDQEHSLTHLSQDQTTTLWSARSILLPVTEDDLTRTTECNAYTTQVTLSDADGTPLANQTVRISASSLSLIAIDGSHFFVDQSGQFATIETNALGMFNVTTVAKGLTTPKIRLAGDFMKQVIDFDPKATVANRLKSISADDLRGATVTRGKAKVPLIPAQQSSQLSNAADALRQLVKVQSRLTEPGKADDVTVDVGDAGPQSYDIRPAISTVTTPLDFSHLPNGTVLTLPVAAPSARLAAPQGIGDVIEVSFGNIWKAITNGLVKVANIVIKKIDDGLRIVINGLESAFSAVLKFAEQVWDVVEWVFKQIGAVIDEIIEWLRFLFEWGDILNTHVVMRKMTWLALNYFDTAIASVESKIAAALDALKPTLAQKSLKWPADGVSHLTIAAVAKGGKAHSLTKDTKTSWIASKVNRHTVGRASSKHSDLPSDSITKTLEGLGENEIKAIQSAYDEVVADIAKNIMHFDLEEIFKRVVAAFTDALLDTMKNVIAVVCDVTKLAIEAIKSILTAHIDIPVITWLYEHVIAPGSKLTILDVSCLIAAVPATVLCKLVADKAPFSSAQADALSEAETLDSFQAIASAQFRTAQRSAQALTDSKATTSAPWEVTAVMSCIAAGSRFFTAILSTVAMFLEEGKTLKIVNIISSATKALTAAISILTTIIGPAKNFAVFILESAVLGVIVSTVIVSFLSNFYPEMSSSFYAINVILGAVGFILVCTNYTLASFVEKDVSDTQRGLKFGMVASMFTAMILNVPAKVKKSKNPVIYAAYYIIKLSSLFCLYSSFALNVTRSILSFNNKLSYVDI